MRPILSRGGEARLRELAAARTLYAFDFDGTLAPIVARAGRARLAPNTKQWLTKLAGSELVAVVSGRGLADLKPRVPSVVHFLIGNHGLEGPATSAKVLARARKQCSRWRHQLEGEIAGFAGIEIEDKMYSLSLHYRRARRPAVARRFLSRLARTLTPQPRVVAGKKVINLVPRGAPHKGIAFSNLMKQVGATHGLYVGDDETDEDVFSFSELEVVSVRVGRREGSRARFFLERQSDINLLLREIIHQLKQTRRGETGSQRTPKGRIAPLRRTKRGKGSDSRLHSTRQRTRFAKRMGPKEAVMSTHRAKDVKRSSFSKGAPAAGRNAHGKRAKISRSSTPKFQPPVSRVSTTEVAGARAKGVDASSSVSGSPKRAPKNQGKPGVRKAQMRSVKARLQNRSVRAMAGSPR